jgi:LysM repeat protein
LNKDSKFSGKLDEAPYQQVWFPGTHSSVGGGGERRGLSDQSLDWVLDGARLAGLELDHSNQSRIFELRPDYSEHLENSSKNGVVYTLMNRFSAADRLPGPVSLEEVSLSAKRRWKLAAKYLKDNRPYRPATLNLAAKELDALPLEGFENGTPLETKSSFRPYVVKRGDALRKIAKEQLGDPNLAEKIFNANLDKIERMDRIYVGSVLRIPIL